MNSQPKIVVTSTGTAPGNVRQAGRGIATDALRKAARLAALGLASGCVALLAACGQKGPLYLPDHPPPSHRHGPSAKPSTPAAAPSSAASSASQPNTATQP